MTFEVEFNSAEFGWYAADPPLEQPQALPSNRTDSTEESSSSSDDGTHPVETRTPIFRTVATPSTSSSRAPATTVPPLHSQPRQQQHRVPRSPTRTNNQGGRSFVTGNNSRSRSRGRQRSKSKSNNTRSHSLNNNNNTAKMPSAYRADQEAWKRITAAKEAPAPPTLASTSFDKKSTGPIDLDLLLDDESLLYDSDDDDDLSVDEESQMWHNSEYESSLLNKDVHNIPGSPWAKPSTKRSRRPKEPLAIAKVSAYID